MSSISLSNILSSYDRIVDVLKDKGIEDVICHQSEIDMVLSLLADDKSKYAYAHEILLFALLHFAQNEIAAHFANTMPVNTWREYMQKATQFQDLQKFKIPKAENAERTLLECIAGTFLMEQYRYDNICMTKKNDVVIDGGACLAETAIWFMRNGARAVHAFEIDKVNLQIAQLNIDEFKYKDSIHLYPYALSDQEKKMDYTPMNGSISGGSIVYNKNNSSYEVDCIPLDKFCQIYNVAPTFIKLDIEGSEEDALRGAVNVIKTYRPKLAVCLYHKWEHRWTIPLFIKNNFDFYSYYIKKSHPLYETVLFCVPKK